MTRQRRARPPGGLAPDLSRWPSGLWDARCQDRENCRSTGRRRSEFVDRGELIRQQHCVRKVAQCLRVNRDSPQLCDLGILFLRKGIGFRGVIPLTRLRTSAITSAAERFQETADLRVRSSAMSGDRVSGACPKLRPASWGSWRGCHRVTADAPGDGGHCSDTEIGVVGLGGCCVKQVRLRCGGVGSAGGGAAGEFEVLVRAAAVVAGRRVSFNRFLDAGDTD